MDVTFSDDTITIDGYYVGFDYLYTLAVSLKSPLVSKLSSTYVIDANIVLKNNATLADTKKTVIINGEYFDIQSGSSLRLGTKSSTGAVSNGCTLSMPNVILENGFGGLDPNNSGNLYCYGSTLNIYGYWSFYKGDNVVEIIGSTIDGYGKISGENSIVKTVTFNRAHGKYGTLINSTPIKEYSAVKVLTVDNYSIGEDLPDLNTIFTLDTNSAAGSVDVYYGEYYGYSNLLTVLDSNIDKPLKLYGSKVLNGYNISRADPNKNDFYHLLRFKPKVQDTAGAVLNNVPIIIKNRLNEIEFEGMTGDDGKIDIWLTRYRDLAGPQPGELLTPFTVTVNHNGVETIFNIDMEENLENFPLVLGTKLANDTSNFGQLVSNIVRQSNDELFTSLHTIEESTKALVLALSDKLTVTNTTIVRGNTKVTI